MEANTETDTEPTQRHHTSSTIELATKMLIAVLDFGAFIGAAYLHYSPTFPPVDWWVFVVLLSILGSLLSIDILRDVRKQIK